MFAGSEALLFTNTYNNMSNTCKETSSVFTFIKINRNLSKSLVMDGLQIHPLTRGPGKPCITLLIKQRNDQSLFYNLTLSQTSPGSNTSAVQVF